MTFLICQSSVFAPDLHVTLDAQPQRRISKVSTSAQKPTSELVPFQSKIESNQIVSATRRDEDVQDQLNYFPKLFRPNFLNRKKSFERSTSAESRFCTTSTSTSTSNPVWTETFRSEVKIFRPEEKKCFGGIFNFFCFRKIISSSASVRFFSATGSLRDWKVCLHSVFCSRELLCGKSWCESEREREREREG